MVPRPMVWLCLALLFVAALGESWQSYGNFTDDNITFIRSILPGPIAAFDADNTNSQIGIRSAKNISDTLNAKWDPAWNVIIVQASMGVGRMKTVLYGYAFRGHWLWFNDYTNTATVIIWKDYNCDLWADVDQYNVGYSSA